MTKLEIACFNIQSAMIAQDHGADRIEFCADMQVGGTTPALGDIQKLRPLIRVDLNVMIRPRGGDFVYTDAEYRKMHDQIIALKELGVDGFVFGILKADKTVDLNRNSELVALASPLPCTFHRAFDEVEDMAVSLESIIQCGFTTVLTSGCEKDVTTGLENLKTLVNLAQERIVTMPGGGLRSSNIDVVLHETGAVYYHSSAITDGGDTAVGAEVRALKEILLSYRG